MKSSLLTNLPALLLFLLLSGSDLAAGQTDPRSRNDSYTYKGSLSPAVAVVVIVAIAALFFMGFFAVYSRHCTGAALDANVDNRNGGVRRVANSTVARGIDALTIEKFPTFVYSEVKTQKIGKGALECAICLNEFEDDETLRLLPKCDHVFHPHCIDAWLQGHVTCPVCRTNLVEEEEKKLEVVEPEVVITETDLESQIPEPVIELDTRVKFSRSHTTGHSVIVPGENIDRFTLRLPEDLRKKIMANWKMNRPNSLLVLPRSGKSVRSDRWLFRKTQSFMWRNRDDGSIKLGGTNSIKVNELTSPTSDSVRADRWSFLRNPSFLWRNTPVPSPRVGVNKDGEGTSSVQYTGTVGSFRLPV